MQTLTAFKTRWRSFSVLHRVAIIALVAHVILHELTRGWLWRTYPAVHWLWLGGGLALLAVTAYRKYMRE